MKKTKLIFPLLIAALLITVNSVHATGIGDFVGSLIPDSITLSLQAMQVFLYDFMALLLDIVTLVLFLVWIATIIGIVYVIYLLMTLPKKMGAKNYHEAIVKLAFMLWEFMI
jgi:prepilin signal peptidase PulO-like enzyme (type II secretory pathway)